MNKKKLLSMLMCAALILAAPPSTLAWAADDGNAGISEDAGESAGEDTGAEGLSSPPQPL